MQPATRIPPPAHSPPVFTTFSNNHNIIQGASHPPLTGKRVARFLEEMERSSGSKAQPPVTTGAVAAAAATAAGTSQNAANILLGNERQPRSLTGRGASKRGAERACSPENLTHLCFSEYVCLSCVGLHCCREVWSSQKGLSFMGRAPVTRGIDVVRWSAVVLTRRSNRHANPAWVILIEPPTGSEEIRCARVTRNTPCARTHVN